MPINLTPTATFDDPEAPGGSDDLNAASIQGALQTYANRTEYSKTRAAALVPGFEGEEEIAITIGRQAALNSSSRWDLGEGQHYRWEQVSVASAGLVNIQLFDFPRKGTVKKISAYFKGGSGHSALPATMPKILAVSRTNSTDLSGVIVGATMTSAAADVAEYEEVHEVSTSPELLLDGGLWQYHMVLAGEAGANAEVGLILVGMTVTIAHA